MEGLDKYSFGRKLLESQGWKAGKGLGRNESGISEAIKPTLKFDKAGVGHNQADDFSFHWWDHVYKKASSNIVVEQSEDGVAMRQKEAQTDLISTKKWKHKKKKRKRSSPEQEPLTYGVFMKSTVLTHEGEVRENAELPSSEDEDHLFHHSDQDHVTFKACEGRTAHKGARHGLTANGKLMRLEAQEIGLLAQVETNGATPDVMENGFDQETIAKDESTPVIKKKRKRRRENNDSSLHENNQRTEGKSIGLVGSHDESCQNNIPKLKEDSGNNDINSSNRHDTIEKPSKKRKHKR